MNRHVLALATALCVSTSPLYGQSAAPQNAAAHSSELTVTTSADVHKSPSVASAVVGKAQRGTVLEIKRNLGSWVEVPWPGGDNGVAFLHVNTGTIAQRAPTAPSTTPPAVAPLSAAAPVGAPGTADARMNAAPQPMPGRRTNILLPSHVFGMGARLNATSEGFGATARSWWANRLGLQVDVMHARTDDISSGGHVNSLQMSPSLLYSLPDGIASALWVRPYVGGGAIVHRASVYRGTSATADSPSRQGLGLQGFGGIETTIAGLPQFAVSADLGYLWSETSLVDVAPRKFRFAFSGHWYVK